MHVGVAIAAPQQRCETSVRLGRGQLLVQDLVGSRIEGESEVHIAANHDDGDDGRPGIPLEPAAQRQRCGRGTRVEHDGARTRPEGPRDHRIGVIGKEHRVTDVRPPRGQPDRQRLAASHDYDRVLCDPGVVIRSAQRRRLEGCAAHAARYRILARQRSQAQTIGGSLSARCNAGHQCRDVRSIVSRDAFPEAVRCP